MATLTAAEAPPRPSRRSARKVWFQVHKWLGLALFLIVIPLSASGSLLVWHDWTDAIFNPARYAVSDAPATQDIATYARAAGTVLQQGSRIASIELPEGPGAPVLVTASPPPKPGAAARPGPPARYQVWLDPGTARIVDHADGSTGILRVLHVFHGSLMIPGTGRTIVGWLGVAMLLSCLSGIWLWWPTVGKAIRGLRWRRGPTLSGNLHHQIGIWIVIPLAILSLSGAWISFPNAMGAVERGFAAAPKVKGPPPPNRRARPAETTRLTPDAAVAIALAGAPRSDLTALRWPTETSGDWTATIAGKGNVAVADASAEAKAARAAGGSPTARFMRQIHDGHSYNAVWQTIIFLGGLAPLLLGITGVIMWLRTRQWRGRTAERKA
jgi:uncharacterized iron-regulated membrane protein